MIPNTSLINALRSVADKMIDSGSQPPDNQWDWYSQEHCNCGLLARELGASIPLIVNEIDDYWSSSLSEIINSNKYDICPTSALPNSTLFSFLGSFGLTFSDFEELESVGTHDFVLSSDQHRQFVIDYFLNKANELESKLTNNE